MKKITKKLKIRLMSILTCAIVAVSGMAAMPVNAAVTTLNPGVTEMGNFVFSDTNTTTSKTVNGTDVTIYLNWRRADGQYGAPNSDQGLGDVKLTFQILNANTGAAITSKQVCYYDSTAQNGYVTDQVHFTVPYGQKIRVWMDASSVNPSASNGKYRSIYIRSFSAFVK